MKRLIPTSCRQVKRRGESLAEMVVVMSVIVGMASMSWPSIRNSLSKNQLQSAAKQVSADLSKARLTAIQTGVPQEFRYQPDQKCYEITPRASVDVEEMSEGVAVQSSASEESMADVIHKELMDGLKFVMESKVEAPQETLLASADGEWSPPIIFFPNGRASQARIELEGDQGLRVEIQLNGMTGTAKPGALHKSE